MSIQEILPLLHQLSRTEKFRLLQYVMNDLAAEEGITPLISPRQYETEALYRMGEGGSPFGADDAESEETGNPT